MSIDEISLEGMGSQGNSDLSGTLDEVMVLKKNDKIKNICDKLFKEYNFLIEKRTRTDSEEVKKFYERVSIANEEIKNILRNDYRIDGINFANIGFLVGEYCVNLGFTFPSGRDGDGFLKFSEEKMTLENVCVYK